MGEVWEPCRCVWAADKERGEDQMAATGRTGWEERGLERWGEEWGVRWRLVFNGSLSRLLIISVFLCVCVPTNNTSTLSEHLSAEARPRSRLHHSGWNCKTPWWCFMSGFWINLLIQLKSSPIIIMMRTIMIIMIIITIWRRWRSHLFKVID